MNAFAASSDCQGMKRKIAAIFAADIAGYSKLVAEDEEETLRRLASYRGVMDDFIARAGGRIFNTAGDAVLAEFPSAVEAVRCAIDIQESLRTRNMAYPPSRQMSFRIGITIGDVVERDGDVLGDGVNIAARLEGIAPGGGICISRTVYEQVSNKLSVQFADIGEQQVKNIPNPVHAYKFEMRSDEQKPVTPAKSASWQLPMAIAVACIVVFGVATFAVRPVLWPQSAKPAGEVAAPPAVAVANAPPAVSVAPSPAAPAPAPTAPAPVIETLVPETVPLIADRARLSVRNDYMGAADHKALAISTGPMAFSTGQADDETAKSAAIDICQKRADALPVPRKCELYAVGTTIVYARGRPPLPPPPWFSHDPQVERPLVAAAVPLLREAGRNAVERNYVPGRKSKALAIGPSGGIGYYFNQESPEEAVRRALELCGTNAGVACIIVAIDDSFVVPVPTTLKVVGFFRPATATVIAAAWRDDLARRLTSAAGWTAVAAGAEGKAGLMIGAADEQTAIDGALKDCAKQDASCRIVAIGPFAVE